MQINIARFVAVQKFFLTNPVRLMVSDGICLDRPSVRMMFNDFDTNSIRFIVGNQSGEGAPHRTLERAEDSAVLEGFGCLLKQ